MMELLHRDPATGDVSHIEHLMASASVLASQQASASTWSPEKRLAAAILSSTLAEIRDRHDDPAYEDQVAEDLEWIYSDEVEWPFSFLRLCDVFGLDPAWVRFSVEQWRELPGRRPERAIEFTRF